ncbi:gamma-glutamylcyclotransferase [Halomonas nitroreducens]|uniref:glutathione-specific gamma-glutamylcyclotransferase n=1 Tax=Halomonas nitroreducens TaxID=447425 RepID=A0A431V2D3_9GAMM|nr:gamma-glutamylcyclotransferase [Halomonas nitroreducens]RTR02938.1 gamma-glutamylcyclotransferase [Halomonas nitroreducens]
MVLDTTQRNRRMTHFDDHEAIWLFGYGSLIWKAGFAYLERRPAHIHGWVRRFWQGSHDHRGTPEAPGRVATLLPRPGAVCHGMAYRITPETLRPLDVREKNGYLREITTLHFADGDTAQGLTYIATEDNAAFLGEAEPAAMARQIAEAHGPSGPNSDYLLHLADALDALGVADPHVADLARRVRAHSPTDDRPQAR